MRKLLRADLYRLLRNKIFHLEIIVTLVLSVWIVLANYSTDLQATENRLYLEDVFFNMYQIFGMLLATAVSLLVGNEYSDGTIRNKLVVGHTRWAIYMAQLLTNLVATTLALLVHSISSGLLGYALFGSLQISIEQFLTMVACNVLIAWGQTTLYTALSMDISAKAIPSVVAILLSWGMLLCANMVYNQLREPETTYESITITENGVDFGEVVENPAYIDGALRTAYEWVLDLLPEGQLLQIQTGETERMAHWPPLEVVYFVVTTGVGYVCFRKKDIR